ncbi:M48 family metallopeptidase [Candidatus Stoquefichus massiliensis]|uniref:M48 family metallopeptidase n=1 Tax=Candidatus Stoquefichus massiliensis TaxID=1470350 RepID=UPI0004859C45|nr:YgjP-like metallopeptidase domain-containing protein [Candidatus Stoquefichus massiliensis]
MKSYQIVLNQQIIDYDVYFKQMKSIRMRVKDGRIVVSAPYLTPISFIEDNIQKYQHQLLKQIEIFEPYAQYQNHGYIYIYNHKYEILLRNVEQKKCQIHDQKLYVYHQNIQSCIDIYLKKILLDYIEEKVIAYLAHDFDLDMPHIEIKKYKGRWGSCYYRENKITFNLSLVHLEKELIDYVIVHELAHFLQPNHSSQFYLEIEKRMPDYKSRLKSLKEKHV